MITTQHSCDSLQNSIESPYQTLLNESGMFFRLSIDKNSHGKFVSGHCKAKCEKCLAEIINKDHEEEFDIDSSHPSDKHE